jgi:hypothetical protein
MATVDRTGRGEIEWKKFVSKFGDKIADSRIIERSRYKVAHVKELMMHYMISPADAFRIVRLYLTLV